MAQETNGQSCREGQPGPTDESWPSRRSLLLRSAALVMLIGVAVAGVMLIGEYRLTDNLVTEAQPRQDPMLSQSLHALQVLVEAIRTGDLQSALAQYGGSLSEEVRALLMELTAQDLRAAAQLESKLTPILEELARAEGEDEILGVQPQASGPTRPGPEEPSGQGGCKDPCSMPAYRCKRPTPCTPACEWDRCQCNKRPDNLTCGATYIACQAKCIIGPSR